MHLWRVSHKPWTVWVFNHHLHVQCCCFLATRLWFDVFELCHSSLAVTTCFSPQQSGEFLFLFLRAQPVGSYGGNRDWSMGETWETDRQAKTWKRTNQVTCVYWTAFSNFWNCYLSFIKIGYAWCTEILFEVLTIIPAKYFFEFVVKWIDSKTVFPFPGHPVSVDENWWCQQLRHTLQLCHRHTRQCIHSHRLQWVSRSREFWAGAFKAFFSVLKI